MRELRDSRVTWTVEGPTLVFERKAGERDGAFICSACRKQLASTDVFYAFTTFHSHRCRKKPAGKLSARAGR